jgi:hypothetical protein
MRKSILLGLALALGACSPSINPQMKAATDGLSAQFQANARSAAVPASYEPIKWGVGQWIVMRTTNEKGEVAIQRISVVGEEAGGVWLEFESQDYHHHTITKILYNKMPRTVDEASDAILKVVTKSDDKQVQTIDMTSGPLAGLQKSMFKSVAQNAVVSSDVAQASKEDVTVPAGTFQGAAKFSVTASFAGMSQKSTSWFHPAVPINGAVKGVSDDGKWKLDLLDYGMTGATSKL